MAQSRWTCEKVKVLVEAIEGRDLDVVEQVIAVTGEGTLPDTVYRSGYEQYGPTSVLVAAIKADDLGLFDYLVEHGMKADDPNWGEAGLFFSEISDILFGPTGPQGKLRSPEMLLKLAHSGFDFSVHGPARWGVLRGYIAESGASVELYETLEKAGLRYLSDYSWREQACGSCMRVPTEAIPWEALLCDGRLDLLKHFILKGYWPKSPLCLKVGADERRYSQDSSQLSRKVIDLICKEGLPIDSITVTGAMADVEADAVGYSIYKGIKVANPGKLFAFLDYDTVETMLTSGVCTMRAEFVGPARAAGRADLLRLYESYGFSPNDVTAEILDQLLMILDNAEYCEDDGELDQIFAENLEPLRLIQAIDEDEAVDWRSVSEALSRVYFAPYEMSWGEASRRAACLDKLSGSRPWTEIFGCCLSRFEGSLDLKLTVPIYRRVASLYQGENTGIGATFWYGQDVGVYALLASRGVELLCKTEPTRSRWGDTQAEEAPDASPGDIFIWLAPDVSEFLFERNGWDKEMLKKPGYWEQHWRGYDYLVPQLIGSGNRAAYQWIMENAADARECKQPSVRELIGSPLLRPFLEGREDGSIRRKDNVRLILETLRGEHADDAALYISKASLDATAKKVLREELLAAKGAGEGRAAGDALALLESLTVKDGDIGGKKPTVPQIVTFVMDALDDGDASMLSMLVPIAKKVPMADCVELLEHAAANCDGAAIDKLYEMLAPFECTSTALNVALFSGNVQTARALVSHGANLDGEMVMVDEKRTPAAKRAVREKRYSHGLIGSSYSGSCRSVANDLKEALTKWEGRLTSRTRSAESLRRSRPKKFDVNEVSGMKAAETLVAISGERGFEKSIAIRLLWNLISFDGRMTKDSRFDSKSARIVLQAGILSRRDIAELPWSAAISTGLSGMTSCSDVEVVKLIRDFAPPQKLPECWRPRFVQNSDLLVIFADNLTAENCKKQSEALRTLAASGEIATLRKLAEKPGWFTKRRVKELIGVSSASGRTEVTAWLLELLNAGTLE